MRNDGARSPTPITGRRKAEELTDEEWLTIAAEVVKALRRSRRSDIRILRAESVGSRIYVVFVDPRGDECRRREGLSGLLRGLHSDLSTGNYEGEYPGSVDQFVLELILIDLLEASSYHGAAPGEIRWKAVPGMAPGPVSLEAYDRTFSG